MTPVRVLHVVESWPPVASGYAQRSGALVAAQANLPDLDPAVLVTSRQSVYGSDRTEPLPGAATVTRLEPGRRERVVRRVRPYHIDRRRLTGAIRRAAATHRAEVVHVHWSSAIGRATTDACRDLDVPVVAEVRFDLAGAAVAQGPRPLALVERRLRRHFEAHLADADAVVAASEETAALLTHEELVSSEVTVVPNGTDIERFVVDRRARSSARSELGAEGLLVIGSTAKQLRYEGLDLLLRAMTEVDREDTLVLLVGEGPERSRLTDLGAELGVHLVCTGSRPASQVPGLLSAMDVFAVPRRQETVTAWASPLKLSEAMAAGLPCVASAVGGSARMLADGRGRLVTPGSVEELGRALADLSGDPDRRAAMGEQARAWIASQPTWVDGAELTSQIYRRVLGRLPS